ncbi:STT3 domain-containing protein [Desulfovibrio litoralis]|uniref:Dolichyl-diphosphooligosaccharide--protein glycosyltransferase n=1 Tax=Desulfovibrio litoralis DSM 11393 TaxID=1121455 RepID=A0A1M7SN62_9BACT|nr:STT3 domain-containing protein [Desulfovibrio litoralis]SHN59917.1 dolichyl-diphosphooligosaccharide--protein glycosyltransferase [Desulfovibrio litoralis DSM 11393]
MQTESIMQNHWSNNLLSYRNQSNVTLGVLLLAVIISFSLSLSLRMYELNVWNNSEYMIEGEHLLSTHDAYHWIAGAEDFEFGKGHPMSLLAKYATTITKLPTAEVAFWLVPILASLIAVAITLWGAVLGYPFAGMGAGIICSLSPSFFGRTTLGSYDTDLITLLFAVLLPLIPAYWLKKYIDSPFSIALRLLSSLKLKNSSQKPDIITEHKDGIGIYFLLFLGGFLGYWSQDWHSLFVYLTRFFALFTPLFILVFARPNTKKSLLLKALLFSLPLSNAFYGGILGGCLLLFILLYQYYNKQAYKQNSTLNKFLMILFKPEKKIKYFYFFITALLWLAVAIFCLSEAVWNDFYASIMSYIKHTPTTTNINNPVLPYPAVTQSIVEVHDIKFKELLTYLHPWTFMVVSGLILFIVLLIFYPSLIFLIPLLAISLSSLKLGGRMGMFGAPIISLGFFVGSASLLSFISYMFKTSFSKSLGLLTALIISLFLSLPIVNKTSQISLGPSISRETAEALIFIKKNTAPNSFVWIWWDWGYAAHHFAKRYTIADGARHSGTSLYLPALVYSTENPFLARQIIKYTAKLNNAPYTTMNSMTPEQIHSLLEELENSPPINAPVEQYGEQYLVVNFDLIPISHWISYFGTWDFKTQKGKDYLVNNLNKNITYNFDSGIIVHPTLQPVYAASIDIFTPEKVERKNYFRITEKHFILNTKTQEKIIVSSEIYNTLMVQLLLSEPNDPRFSPYFELVFDNTFTRVFRVK